MDTSEVVRIAKADVGYTECVGPESGCPKHPQAPGCNHTAYGARFGLNGEPWCAVYTWDLWTRGGHGDLVPKTAGAWDMLARAASHGWALPPQTPRVGDIPVYQLGDGHVGGVVTQVRSATGFTAVEGNTSRGNRGSQVNGWYVAERYRTVSQLRGLIRLPIDAPQEADMPLTEADLDAIAKRVWTVGWPTSGGRSEAAQDRLLQAARGVAVAPALQALLDAVTGLQRGAPVSLPADQMASLAGVVADHVVAQVGPALAGLVAAEIGRRITNG